MKVHGVSFYRLSEPMPLQGHSGSVLDMLRHDVAFVKDDERDVVAFPLFKATSYYWGRGKPTLGRWHSFGVSVTPILTGLERTNLLRSFELGPPVAGPGPFLPVPSPQGWTTWGHAVVPGAITDSGRLIPMPLQFFLDAEGPDSIQAARKAATAAAGATP